MVAPSTAVETNTVAMLQPPLSDPEVHNQAMSVHPDEARRLWAKITIDAEQFHRFNDLRAGLRVRGFQRSRGVIWQFDGQTYPLDDEKRKGPMQPGEVLWVPLIVAQYGVRNSSVWEYETNEAGQIINKQDFLYGQQVPIIRILEVRDPGSLATQMANAPQVAPAICPFCSGSMAQERLAEHIKEAHGSEIAAALNGTTPAPARGQAREAVKKWAARSAGTEGNPSKPE